MSKLTVYTKDWCGYCVQVKNQLADMHIEFEEINIEDNAEQKAWVIEQGHTTMPQIYLEGNLFVQGGADGLAKLSLYEIKERLNGYDLGDLSL
jgi:glutaredoxin 3